MPDLISRIVLSRVKCRSKDFYRITACRQRTYQSESDNRIKGGPRYNFNGRPLTRWRTISSLFLSFFLLFISRFSTALPFPFLLLLLLLLSRLLLEKIPRHVLRNPTIKIRFERFFYSSEISRSMIDMSLDGFLNNFSLWKFYNYKTVYSRRILLIDDDSKPNLRIPDHRLIVFLLDFAIHAEGSLSIINDNLSTMRWNSSGIVSEVRLVDDREINFRPSPLNIALESMPKLMPSGCLDRGISLCPCACELLDEFQACNESTIAPSPYSFPYSFRINPRDARLPWYSCKVSRALSIKEFGQFYELKYLFTKK